MRSPCAVQEQVLLGARELCQLVQVDLPALGDAWITDS
jgi:hypothetical protein